MKAPSERSPSARTMSLGVDSRGPSNKMGERPRCLFIVRAESTRDGGAPGDHHLTRDPIPPRGGPHPHGPRPRILGPRSVGDCDVHDRSPTRRRGRVPLRRRPGRRPRRAHPGDRRRGDREYPVHETREGRPGVPRRPPRRGRGLRTPRRPSSVHGRPAGHAAHRGDPRPHRRLRHLVLLHRRYHWDHHRGDRWTPARPRPVPLAGRLDDHRGAGGSLGLRPGSVHADSRAPPEAPGPGGPGAPGRTPPPPAALRAPRHTRSASHSTLNKVNREVHAWAFGWSLSNDGPRGAHDALPTGCGLRVVDGLPHGRPPASRLAGHQHTNDPATDRERDLVAGPRDASDAGHDRGARDPRSAERVRGRGALSRGGRPVHVSLRRGRRRHPGDPRRGCATEAGKITLIDSGSDFVYHLTTLLSVRAVMEGHEVVFLDGGNSVDPHGMVALGKRAAMTREEILPRVHVARAFTCHQMTTLILDMLDKKIEETRAGLVVLACLPTMFLDEDVEVGEAHQLFQRSMRAIRQTVGEREVVGLVTNAGLAKLHRRKSIRRQLYEGADRAIRIAHGKGGVLIHRLDTGTSEWYAAVPPDQTTMDDFAVAAPRIPAFGVAGASREIRLTEHLRLGW